jgi:hypothetical protein
MLTVPVRQADAEAHLAHALLRSAQGAGLAIAIDHRSSRPWASATFDGIRLSLDLVAPRAPALGRWLCDLPLAELPLQGRFVASLALDRIEDDGALVRTTLTVLVIDEA